MDLMSTKEVARYLGINEKQVYALIRSRKIPATRVTGKWVFPRHLVDEWIEQSTKAALDAAQEKANRSEGAFLASGSNDPILDMLLSFLRRSRPETHIFSESTGSTEGLKALAGNYTDIAWSHLLDPKSQTYNVPFLSQYAPGQRLVILNLFYRELGILTDRGNPRNVAGLADLANSSTTMINRQTGSGTRIFLDHNLEKLGIPGNALKGYENEVYTHMEVGISIMSGEADAGIATASVAQLLGLGFIPLTRESFDMIMEQSTFFKPEIQAIIGSLNSPEFRKKAEKLGGYDFRDSGKIMYAAA